MTIKRPEPEDPMELVGVTLSEGLDDQALTEMAWSFVEEYARMGWSGERILRAFRNPFYRGPHQILEAKGEEFVRGLTEMVDRLRSQVGNGSGDSR